MNRFSSAFLLADAVLTAALMTACSREVQLEPEEVLPEPRVFHAFIDNGAETKTYSDAGLSQFWNADDRISIFDQSTVNLQYSFDGDDGAAEGTFSVVTGQGNESGSVLPKVYAVYPYRDGNSIDYDGVITTELPDVQVSRAGTYPLEAHTMVAVSSGTDLTFRNATGFVVVRVKGSGNAVTEITLTAKGGEKLSGPATVTVGEDGIPQFVMSEGGQSSVKLSCPVPIVLGEEPTEFWMTLPPTVLTKGFTLGLKGNDGGEVEVGTDKEFSVRRNAVKRISAVVLPSGPGFPDPYIETLSFEGEEPYRLEKDEEDDTVFILTVPTMTDFSAMQMAVGLPVGMTVSCGDAEVPAGPLVVDATGGSATLVARSGNKEKTYTLRVRNSGLPVVRINTVSGEDPKDKETWLEGSTIRIEKADGTLDYEGQFSLRGRGNGTWAMPKKPYAIKLEDSSKILGMPKHKRWILLANWGDRTLLRNVAAFWLAEHTESLAWTPRGQFVELVLNGTYRGNYFLCEQIKINKNRLNIPEMADFETDPQLIREGGFHLEIDPYDQSGRSWRNEFGPYYAWNEAAPKFITERFHLPISIKEPDEDAISSEQFEYMKGFVNELEERLFSPFESEVVYSNEQYTSDGTAGGALDTGIKLFDGSYPNGFRMVFDLDIPEQNLSVSGMHTYLTCMDESGQTYPGFTLRHLSQNGAKGEFVFNDGVRGQFNLSTHNHIVLTFFGKTVSISVNNWRVGGSASVSKHDYPLTIGGAYGTYGNGIGEWKQDRFAACTISNMTIEKIGDSGCTWMEMLDPETFIDFVLVQEMAGNQDFWQNSPAFGPTKGNYPYSGAPHSMHIYKHGGLLKAGPVWDFDYRTFTSYTQNRWIGLTKNPWYVQALSVSEFRDRLVEKWENQKQTFLGLMDFLDQESDRLSISESFNHEMWPIVSSPYFNVNGVDNGDENLTYPDAIERMKQQFQIKWEYIDSHISDVH